jgi:Xaa-Pro aminopeptidase
LIEEAVAITGLALRKAIARIEPGLYEYQVQALIEGTFRWQGAEGLAFGSIVGTGLNSTTLHHRAGRDRIEPGDLVLMDVGCRYRGYCADLTRTVPASGNFTDRQRQVYETVLAARAAALAEVRPGGTLEAVDAAARRTLRRAGLGEHVRHGIGHWLGLAVHDPGGGSRLQPGMVLTIEPGVYLEEEGFGIRIEDDVVVTEDGHRVLSADLPRTVEEIERLMAGE